jgi:hypothetical protein
MNTPLMRKGSSAKGKSQRFELGLRAIPDDIAREGGEKYKRGFRLHFPMTTKS